MDGRRESSADLGVSRNLLLPLHEQTASIEGASLLSGLPHLPVDSLFSSPLLPYTSVLPLGHATPPTTPPHNIPSGHRSYTLEFKLSVVDWIQCSNSSIRAASKQFGVDRKLIRTWLQSRDTLSSAMVTHGPNRRKLHSGAPPLSETIDQYVLQYLVQRRQEGYKVGEKEVQCKALECASSLGLQSFKATSTWFRGWKHRQCVQWGNGTFDVLHCREAKASSGIEVRGAALLSHVSPRDRVKLPPTSEQSCRSELPVESATCAVVMDYSSKEHNYAKPPLTSTDLSTVNHSSLLLSPSLPPHTYTAFDISGDMTGDVTALELPLGHEEVVIDSNLSHKKSPQRTSKGCGRIRRSVSTSSLSLSPTAVTTFPAVDERAGLGVMLANRLSQPVFPAGPEIVYVDTPTPGFST